MLSPSIAALAVWILCSVGAASFSATTEQRTFDKKRTTLSECKVNDQSLIPGGEFYMGSQFYFGEKIMTSRPPDGAAARKKKSVAPFFIDKHAVTNEQFDCFVKETQYITETEGFGWSFVFEPLASSSTIEQADDPEAGLGRVKDTPHWLGVKGASYRHPHGPDSDIATTGDHPVVQISYRDATDYCRWAGARLPSEKEWEFAARAGLVNMSYAWGGEFLPNKMNIWQGDFPYGNTMEDGYLGSCPVSTFEPNAYGLHNMLGNVWEWASGGKPAERIQRGGGFVDTKDGKPNHAVMTSTRQILSGDSTANTQGFRCAASVPGRAAPLDATTKASKGSVDSSFSASDAEDVINIEL